MYRQEQGRTTLQTVIFRLTLLLHAVIDNNAMLVNNGFFGFEGLMLEGENFTELPLRQPISSSPNYRSWHSAIGALRTLSGCHMCGQ